MIEENDEDHHHASASAATSVIEESLMSHHEKEKGTRKKSTLNRITELISKSPILESVRNRPSRLKGATKAQTISTTADKQLIAEAVENTATTTAKKTTRGTKSTLKKASLLDEIEHLKTNENIHHPTDHEMSEAEDGVKPKKTRRMKK